MLSGRRLNLLNPTPLDVEIEDIAHGLSRVARWNGQTKGDWPYSVADHSVMVETLFTAANPGIATRWRLAALLHDAPEYVIGDMITPFKSSLGVGYRDIETRLSHAIHLRFGLPGALPSWVEKAIGKADKVAAYIEAVQIAGFSETEAKRIIARPSKVPEVVIRALPPNKAKTAYLEKFERLYDGGDTRS